MPQQVSAATYYRVSTDDQSVEMQRADIHAYCAQRNFTIYREYCDHGISGTKERRPALDELMADARKRKFDVVLVWDFSRFARSTQHLINALEEFRHLGIDFISLSGNISTRQAHWGGWSSSSLQQWPSWNVISLQSVSSQVSVEPEHGAAHWSTKLA